MRKETTIPISRRRKRRTPDSCLPYLALAVLLICGAFIAWNSPSLVVKKNTISQACVTVDNNRQQSSYGCGCGCGCGCKHLLSGKNMVLDKDAHLKT
jgi:hypothetical protein